LQNLLRKPLDWAFKRVPVLGVALCYSYQVGDFLVKTKTALLSTAVGSLLAFGMTAMTAHAADDPNTEKCYGIVKAGKNDCAGAAHACAGQSKTEANGKEWVKLPKGTCERIVGGSTTAK